MTESLRQVGEPKKYWRRSIGASPMDQAYILGELIRYLERPRSGALEFEDMGPSWVSVPASTLTHPGTAQPLKINLAGPATQTCQRADAHGRLVAQIQYETAGQ